MQFLPWWALVACLAASALAAYLFLGRTRAGDSPWALFALTAVAAPVVLAGAMAVALVLSTLLSAFLDDRTASPAGRAHERGGDHRRDRPRDDLGAHVPRDG